ncbi:chemotaxis protein CheW [Sessilibacter sp. MAH2]
MTDQNTAFRALASLASRCRSFARDLPAQEETQQQWSGLGFGLLGKNFIVPMGQVSEVLEVPSYTKLPGVKPWVKGVSNVRGRLLPLMDLASYLGYRLTSPVKRQRILILENQELYCGLIVDHSYGIQHFLAENYQPEAVIDEETLNPLLLGNYLDTNKGKWFVFSMVNLIQTPDFLSAAKL